ncbi:MAG TPA: dihydropteroate synthase [Polyangiaceae bacterium]|nr:dihydropteroate synthase [Polyangiaceae bacterium]
MGVCNVTPDSFSDGGLHFDPSAARARVDALLAEGADIIDIGGESTRPGAEPVPPSEQLGRVLEVVRYAAGLGACVSIDTANPEVATACLEAGAAVVNDVSCLLDGVLGRVVAASGAALVLMHARGIQKDMTGFSRYPDAAYGDVVRDVCDEWEAAADRARSAGVPGEALVMDPGLGFAKNARHSAELLARLDEVVRAVGVPVAVGASRKSFLTVVDPVEGRPRVKTAPSERIGASIAAALHAVRAGAQVLRVHDVRATGQALDLERVLTRPPATANGARLGGGARA